MRVFKILIILCIAFSMNFAEITQAKPTPREAEVTAEAVANRQKDCLNLQEQYISVMEVTGISKADIRQVLNAIAKTSSPLMKTGAMVTGTGLVVSLVQSGTALELNLLTKTGLLIAVPTSLFIGANEIYKQSSRRVDLEREHILNQFDISSEPDRLVVLDFLKQRIESCQVNLEALQNALGRKQI